MSNVECNVVRDLMPLCIDDAASEESQMTVREHVAVCSACAEVFHEMQAKLNASVLPVEDKTLDEAAKKINTKRIRRVVVTGLVGMVIGILLFLLVTNMNEIIFRAKYVRLNGDLRFEAVYAKAAAVDAGPMRCIYMSSFPSGLPKFEWDISDELIHDGAGLCIRLRPIYRGWVSEDHDTASILFWGNSEDGVWTAYSSETNENVPVHRVELVSGNEFQVLWELGDLVQTQQEMIDEADRLELEMKGR